MFASQWCLDVQGVVLWSLMADGTEDPPEHIETHVWISLRPKMLLSCLSSATEDQRMDILQTERSRILYQCHRHYQSRSMMSTCIPESV